MRTNEVYSCVVKFFGWTNNIKAVSKVQVVCLFLGNKDKDVLMFFFHMQQKWRLLSVGQWCCPTSASSNKI